jgi:hypothetical protein
LRHRFQVRKHGVTSATRRAGGSVLMSVTRSVLVGSFLLMFSAQTAAAQSFFSNFLKPEYMVPVSDFPAASGGDLTGVYMYVPIPLLGNGELLIVGEFPRARLFSITAYDDHGGIVSTLHDQTIQPYGTSQNPFAPGGPADAEDMLYAVTVRFGAPMALNPWTQCATPFPVHGNVLDARSRHTAGGFYSSQQSNFTAEVPGLGTVTHDNTTTNTATHVILRFYDLKPPAPTSQFDLRRPWVWVRASNTGCAPPLTTAGQRLSPSNWFSLDSVLQFNQVFGHVEHEIALGEWAPYGLEIAGDVTWAGQKEFLPGRATGRNVSGALGIDPAGFPTTGAALNAQGRVMLLQFRRPTTPAQLRYWSLTFESATGTSLATIKDSSLVADSNGYTNLVVSFGTPLPSYVTAANGYTSMVLSPLNVDRAVLRNFLPAEGFTCTTDFVPYRTAEYHAAGGYMGEYAPVVTYPLASTLPATAVPLAQSGTCELP